MPSATKVLTVMTFVACLLGCSTPGTSDEGASGTISSPSPADSAVASATPASYPPTETIPRGPAAARTPILAGRTFLLTGSNAVATQPALSFVFGASLVDVRIDCGAERVIALCGDVAAGAPIEQDVALIAFLGTAVNATLDGDLLTLRHPDGKQFLELQLQGQD